MQVDPFSNDVSEMFFKRYDWMQVFIMQGALATAATFCLITRVIPKRGPTYPPMFNPLALIFTSFFEALIFGQAITLGRYI